MDCNLPGSSIHGILQARILAWVAISFSRGSSPPRDRADVPLSPALQMGSFPLSHLGSPAASSLWHLRGAWLGCWGVVWVHGSSPSFPATQVLFTAHLPMSPGDRAQQQSPLPQEGRGGRSEKTAMCPKTSAHPLQSRGPGAGLRAWYSLSVAASGGRGLGGPWDFRTPREGLDPLAIQLPPTSQCRELSGAAHALQNPLPPSPHPPGSTGKECACHQLPWPGRKLAGSELHIAWQGLLSEPSK